MLTRSLLSASSCGEIWTVYPQATYGSGQLGCGKKQYNRAVQQLTTARALTDAVQTHHGDISQLASEAEAHAAWVEWATDLMDGILTALATRNALPPSRASHQLITVGMLRMDFGRSHR